MTMFNCPADLADYSAWTYAHAKEGRVLVKVGKRYRLHAPFCDHIFFTDGWDGKIASSRRWCFDTDQEARQFCSKESGKLPLLCESCAP